MKCGIPILDLDESKTESILSMRLKCFTCNVDSKCSAKVAYMKEILESTKGALEMCGSNNDLINIVQHWIGSCSSVFKGAATAIIATNYYGYCKKKT